MRCVICHGEGPFTYDACVLNESRPMCDLCADAVDALSDGEVNGSVWEKHFDRIHSAKGGITDKAVSAFISDVLKTARSSPHYAHVEKKMQDQERTARRAEEARRDAEAAPYNAVYEYAVESILDNPGGDADISRIQSVISAYASRGWRLQNSLVNEIGKTGQSSGAAGFVTGTNATIEQTILIFERCVRPAKKND